MPKTMKNACMHLTDTQKLRKQKLQKNKLDE